MTVSRDDKAQDGWDLIVAPWHLDERIASFPIPAGGAELACPRVPGGSEFDRLALRNQAVADAVAKARRPLLLSGDCTVGLGTVAGLQRRHSQVGVVWLDAHGDFNTPAITTSGYLAGMSLALLTGRAPELDCDLLGLRPVADGDVVLVDARDLDPAERDALAASQVHRVPADPDAMSAAVAGLGQPWRVPAIPGSPRTVAATDTLLWRYVTKDGNWVMVRDTDTPSTQGNPGATIPNWFFMPRDCLNLED